MVLPRCSLDDSAVGQDHAHPRDPVDGQAVTSRQPTQPSPERVADGAHVRSRAQQGRQPVLLRGRQYGAPPGAAADGGDGTARVDRDVVEGAQVDQQGGVVGGHRHAVPGGLHGDGQTLRACVPDCSHHVLHRGGPDGGGRPLVESEVPAGAGDVVLGIAGRDQRGHGSTLGPAVASPESRGEWEPPLTWGMGAGFPRV